MASPPPPVLMDELVEEALLRLPPDDPASLARAALVCRRWRRLVPDPAFSSRFRRLHRSPPMLGYLSNLGSLYGYLAEKKSFIARFVPTSSFRPPRADRCGWRALDARHGRVLLHNMPWSRDPRHREIVLCVWDPITGEQRELPKLLDLVHPFSWNAAVLCAAGAGCDHLDCHRGPFIVVFVANCSGEMLAYLYSSETGKWSRSPLSKNTRYLLDLEPGVLVANALYFMFQIRKVVLEFDLGTGEMNVIPLPPACFPHDRVMLTTMEDGKLGFATVHEFKLYIWSWEPHPDNGVGWARKTVLELKKLLPVDALATSPEVVGSAHGNGAIFVQTDGGLFTVDIKTKHVKMVGEGVKEDQESDFYSVIPFMSFCTPWKLGTSMLR